MSTVEVGTRCDFCSKPDPEWEYPTEPFELKVENETLGEQGQVVKHSNEESFDGPWLACDDCHEAIESGGVEQITERVVSLYMQVDPTLADPVLKDRLQKHASEMYTQFHNHRTGKPVQTGRQKRE